MNARALQRLIHAGARALALDDDARRDLQQLVTGRASLTGMTEAEMRLVLDALKARGFDPAAGRPRRGRPAAPRADLRLVHVLWRLLAEAGAVRRGGRAGLNAFIRARFGTAWGHVPLDIDAMRQPGEIADVIEALRDMCRRAGIVLR